MLHTFLLTLIGGLISLVVCLYTWRRGHLEDCEDIKYQIFRDDQE